MNTKLLKTLATAAALSACVLASAQANASGPRDSGIAGDRYGYTMHNGKRDPYSEGANLGKRDPYPKVPTSASAIPTAKRARGNAPRDPYSEGNRAGGMDRRPRPDRRFRSTRSTFPAGTAGSAASAARRHRSTGITPLRLVRRPACAAMTAAPRPPESAPAWRGRAAGLSTRAGGGPPSSSPSSGRRAPPAGAAGQVRPVRLPAARSPPCPRLPPSP